MPDQQEPEKDRTFVARYGAIILRGGIAAIPQALFQFQAQLGLSPQQAWFIAAILARKWDADLPHPSLVRLAQETGVSRQKLHQYQKQLIAAGWLCVINRRTAVGGKDSNSYDFSVLLQRLEDLIQEEQDRHPGTGNASGGRGEGGGHVNRGLHTHVNTGRHPHVTTGLHEYKESLEKNQLSISNVSKAIAIGKSASHRYTIPESKGPEQGRSFLTPTGGGSTAAVNQPHRTGPTQPHATGPTAVGELLPTSLRKSRHQLAENPPERETSRAGGVELSGVVPAAQTPRKSHSSGHSVDAGHSSGVREAPSVYVASVMSELSDRLGDAVHTRSNVTRAARLLRASGVDEQVFVGKLYEAASITRQMYAPGSRAGPRRPGAYFFRVVEDLLTKARTSLSARPEAAPPGEDSS